MRRRNPSLLKQVGLLAGICVLFYGRCFAQCTNNLGAKTYDTTLTNNGYANYSLSFPQWSPDSGQLVSVKISANVTNTYGFILRNVNTVPANYDLFIGQEDQFTLASSAPYTSINPLHVGTYSLTPGQSEIDAPFPFLTNQLASDSITGNTAPFLGSGTVNVNYLSFTYTNLVAYNNASYYFSNSVNSTTQFSLQYLYCKAGIVLAANLTRWSATLTAPLTIQLDWSTVNETAGREYDLQRSSDGHSFTTIATTPATGDATAADYNYTDHLPYGSTGDLYYRLQIRDKDEYSWSPVRQIDLGAAEKTLRIYPNPVTDHIDIATGTAASDWNVEIFSTSGSLVQRETLLMSNILHVPFNNRLSAGTYFVRLTNLRGQKTLVSSFVVHGPN